MLFNSNKNRLGLSRKEVHRSLLGEDLLPVELTEEEMAIIFDEEIEKEPTIEELQALVPGYKERILAGVLAEIERRAQADALADVKASSDTRMKRRALMEALIRMESISPCDALVGRRGF